MESAGDRFDRLAARWRDLPKKLARAVGMDAAHDAVQSALCRTWRALESPSPVGETDDDLDRIYMRAVRRAVTDIKRREARDRRFRDRYERLSVERVAECNSERDLEANEVRRILDECLATLPPRQRSVMELVRSHGKAWSEIADSLGVNINTARSNFRKAVMQLQRRLAERGIVHPVHGWELSFRSIAFLMPMALSWDAFAT